MFRIAVLALLAAFSSAQAATTQEGWSACRQREHAEDMAKFKIADDRASFDAYIRSRKCVVLRGDLAVTVTEEPGVFGGVVGFVYHGLKLWSARDALQY